MAGIQSHLVISITSSSPTISLSDNPTATSLQLIATARIISSSQPTSAVTLCTVGSILDNGQHERQDGLFWGALWLSSTTDPNRYIQIGANLSPNYGSKPNASPNLREQSWMRFESVPPQGQGTLTIKHDISLERIFRYSRKLKAAEVHPGEKFRSRMYHERPFWCTWWTFGGLEDDDLKDKKFGARRGLTGEDRNRAPGENRPDIEQMEKEGWVFSQKLDNLKMTEDDTGQEVIVEFVK